MTLTASHTFVSQVSDQCVNVITHQIELVHVVFLRWMDRDFRRRKAEDQPTAADVDVR